MHASMAASDVFEQTNVEKSLPRYARQVPVVVSRLPAVVEAKAPAMIEHSPAATISRWKNMQGSRFEGRVPPFQSRTAVGMLAGAAGTKKAPRPFGRRALVNANTSI